MTQNRNMFDQCERHLLSQRKPCATDKSSRTYGRFLGRGPAHKQTDLAPPLNVTAGEAKLNEF